eukprot:365123-Chlamydomonas_euryale.AAC.10
MDSNGKGSPWPLDAAEHSYGQASWQLLQRLGGNAHIQQAVALTHLPGDPSRLLLATGGTDKSVRLYAREPERAAEFVAMCSLPGHDNWVRSLAFCHTCGAGAGAGSSSGLLLASASQDRYGRIWAIQEEQDGESAASASPVSAADAVARYAPKPRFCAGGRAMLATMEALLIGHEDWVHSVAWRPPPLPPAGAARSGRHTPQPFSDLCLLSASMDRTMMLWQHDPGSGLWMSQAAVGDAGAQCLGYFGGVFSADGRSVLAHGFTGALHLWDRVDSPTCAAASAAAGSIAGSTWAPRPALGGHFGAVTGCCWAADGGCLLSVSEDQTARMFTRLRGASWCEVARPQVHGHDFTCVASVPSASGSAGAPPYAYISGSEEKMLRAFEAPQVCGWCCAAVSFCASRAWGSAEHARTSGGQHVLILGALHVRIL